MTEARSIGKRVKTQKRKIPVEKEPRMSSVTLRMPEDVVEELKKVAPLLGFSGYQPLIRAYVGEGLRRDLQRLENDAVSGLVAGLKRRGVSASVIDKALAEVRRG